MNTIIESNQVSPDQAALIKYVLKMTDLEEGKEWWVHLVPAFEYGITENLQHASLFDTAEEAQNYLFTKIIPMEIVNYEYLPVSVYPDGTVISLILNLKDYETLLDSSERPWLI